MKNIEIQMDDNTYWAILWTSIITGVVVMAVTGIICYSNSTKKALTLGYIQKQAMGDYGTMWVKP